MVRVSGWITHGIHCDRERRLGPLIDDETGSFRLRGQAEPDRQTPRFGAETQDCRLADRDSYAIGLATGAATWIRFLEL